MYTTSKKEIQSIRNCGRVLATIVEEILDNAEAGVSTYDLDILAEKRIREEGGIPVLKGYKVSGHRFPATMCACINDEVVHGIPHKNRILREGDLFKVDIDMQYEGFITDMARTKAIGNVSSEAQKLIQVTQESWKRGVETICHGAYLNDYAEAVQGYVEKNGFSVVRDLVGHGVGRKVHEEPQIPNYVERGFPNFEFRKGMIVALEPMVNIGSYQVKLDDDHWTIRTADGSLSAHYENTVLVTDDGVEILTQVA